MQPHTVELKIPDGLTPANVSKMMQPSELADMQKAISKAESDLKALKADFALGLQLKYGDKVMAAFQSEKKGTGKIHMTDGNIGMEVDISKKVDWDQDKIRSVLDQMDAETALHYAKVKITVAERDYNSAPPDIKPLLAAARTVTPGTPRITFEQLED